MIEVEVEQLTDEEKKEKLCKEGKNPKDCDEEQIRKCHGDVKKHQCEEESEG